MAHKVSANRARVNRQVSLVFIGGCDRATPDARAIACKRVLQVRRRKTSGKRLKWAETDMHEKGMKNRREHWQSPDDLSILCVR
jgi:hypothetical protein